MVKRGKRKLFLALTWFLSVSVILLMATELQSQELQRQNPVPMNEESVAAGQAVFTNFCAGCHGRRADGRGRQALNLIPKPQNLRNVEFVEYLTDERMFSSIAGGVRGTSMPPFEMLMPADDHWNVINYIRSLTDGEASGIPNALAYQEVGMDQQNPVPATLEILAAGRDLYLNFCSSCHGAAADGAGPIAPNLVPAPRNLVVVTSFGEKPFIDYLNDARLYDSLTNGVPGTSMQPWISVLTDEERWSIIGWLRGEADVQREKGEQISF